MACVRPFILPTPPTSSQRLLGLAISFDARDFSPQDFKRLRNNPKVKIVKRCKCVLVMTTNTTAFSTNPHLAINGGPKAVTADAPTSWLHGPQEIGEEEIQAVTAVLKDGNLFRFWKAPGLSSVEKFEKLFAEKTGAKYVLAVNSGTSALIAGLVGIGVSQGDEVLVPSYTYIATAAAVLTLGAFPVIVEIDASLTMDPEDMEKKITARTKAVIPVHMRGVPCAMDRIGDIARKHGIKILEDCAQANGGEFRGQSVGTFGDAGAFSLQHFKIITAGEGGVVVTNNKDVMDRASIYHDSAYTFWMENNQDNEENNRRWRDIAFLGENYRQSELHGAVAFEQLKKRDRILARTRAIKRKLWAAFEAIPGVQMEAVNDRDGDCGISMAFFAESEAKARSLCEALREEGVNCGTFLLKQIPDRHVFYHWNYIMEKRSPHLNGFPWNALENGRSLEYSKEMCPKTLALLNRVIVMPITQVMSDAYVDEVCRAAEKMAKA